MSCAGITSLTWSARINATSVVRSAATSCFTESSMGTLLGLVAVGAKSVTGAGRPPFIGSQGAGIQPEKAA